MRSTYDETEPTNVVPTRNTGYCQRSSFDFDRKIGNAWVVPDDVNFSHSQVLLTQTQRNPTKGYNLRYQASTMGLATYPNG